MLRQTEEIRNWIYPVIIIFESAIMHTEGLVKIRNDESGINLFGSPAGGRK